jgi:hypothetical protein
MFLGRFLGRGCLSSLLQFLRLHTPFPGNKLTFFVCMTLMRAFVGKGIRLKAARVQLDQQVGTLVTEGEGDPMVFQGLNVLFIDRHGGGRMMMMTSPHTFSKQPKDERQRKQKAATTAARERQLVSLVPCL